MPSSSRKRTHPAGLGSSNAPGGLRASTWCRWSRCGKTPKVRVVVLLCHSRGRYCLIAASSSRTWPSPSTMRSMPRIPMISTSCRRARSFGRPTTRLQRLLPDPDRLLAAADYVEPVRHVGADHAARVGEECVLLTWHRDDLVACRVADDGHRVLAALDLRELLVQDLAQQDHALVRGAEVLCAAVGDLPRRHPGHHVLP